MSRSLILTRSKKLLLRKIVIRTGANANRRNSMDTDAKRNTMEERISETHEDQVRQNLSRVHYRLERIQPADRRQNACASSRSTEAGRRLINDDKRDENGFDLSGE